MAYKKYIIKNGKTYGPYTYHSRRVNGKVVSDYHGKHEKPVDFDKYQNIALIVFGFLMLALLIYFSFNFIQTNLTGQAIVDLETTYTTNGTLEGVLRLFLKQGELLPAETHVLIETASGKQHDYLLSELIGDSEETIEGNFYVEGRTLSGTGIGYGVPGAELTNPNVFFTLEVVSNEEIQVEEQETEEESQIEESTATTQSPVQNETTSTQEETTAEESSNETQEETTGETEESEIESTETQPEETAETSEQEFPITAPQSPAQEEVISEEETTEESQPETSSAGTTQETSGETEISSNSEQTSVETTPITGEAVANLQEGVFAKIIKRIFSAFTGQATAEIGTEIQGQVTASKPFTQKLNQGQTVFLQKGSVRTSSQELGDEIVDVSFSNNGVTVTTDFYISEPGFGEEYLGSTAKELQIDLSTLDVEPEEGVFIIDLIYQDEEIISVESNLILGETTIAGEETTIEFTNVTTTSYEQLVLSKSLLQEEIDILVSEFGNETINTTKAEIFNERLIVRHEIGDYWIEYSYDFFNQNIDGGISPELENEIQVDMVKWLKDLTVKISSQDKTEEDAEQIESLIGNKELNSINPVSPELAEEEIQIEEQETEEESQIEESTATTQSPVQNETTSTQEETTAEESSNETQEETTGETEESEIESTETQPEETAETSEQEFPITAPQSPAQEEVISEEETTEESQPETSSAGTTPITGIAIGETQGSGILDLIKNFFRKFFG